MPDSEDVYWDSFLPALLDHMSAMMRDNITAVVSSRGITSAHAIYLVALELQGGQTLLGLSRFLDLDAANTNRVIKVLRDKGFVYDDRKTETGRKYSVFLTLEGQSLASEIMDGIVNLNDGYFKGIPREDLVHMRNTLIRILMNMSPDVDGTGHEDPFYARLHIEPLDEDEPVESGHPTDAETVPRRTAKRRRSSDR